MNIEEGEKRLGRIERRKRRERRRKDGFWSKERKQARRERMAKLLGILGGEMLGTRKVGWAAVAVVLIGGLALILKWVL